MFFRIKVELETDEKEDGVETFTTPLEPYSTIQGRIMACDAVFELVQWYYDTGVETRITTVTLEESIDGKEWDESLDAGGHPYVC